jgi:hypothetical protein
MEIRLVGAALIAYMRKTSWTGRPRHEETTRRFPCLTRKHLITSAVLWTLPKSQFVLSRLLVAKRISHQCQDVARNNCWCLHSPNTDVLHSYSQLHNYRLSALKPYISLQNSHIRRFLSLYLRKLIGKNLSPLLIILRILHYFRLQHSGNKEYCRQDLNALVTCLILGFRRFVNDIFALLGCYAA